MKSETGTTACGASAFVEKGMSPSNGDDAVGPASSVTSSSSSLTLF